MKKRMRMLCLLLLLPCLFACGQEAGAEGEVKMTAEVTAIGDRIEVEVIEGEYGAEGPYHVIVGDGATFSDANGNAIAKGDIKAGDTVEIYYSGQVMLSYPPQIVAVKIIKK